ncbi:MAG: penicillin-insensitive murein endopeptidase [Rhodospirillaceae bacterium]|nr:penicillin-insensitive murein endopeptidase [Rhodospirillaceae bacterium]
MRRAVLKAFAAFALAGAAVAAPAGPALAQGAWATVWGPAIGPPAIYGGYSEGCLRGAVALPLDGPGYQVVRPAWRRYFGHPDLIAFVERFGERIDAAGLGVMPIADIAQPRGGPITGHVSHEIGLDVDIWLRLDLPRLDPDARNELTAVSLVSPATGEVDPELWTPAHAEAIRLAAIDDRVARIFVNPAIKRALCAMEWEDPSWLRYVVPWQGHDAHMHVRLHCPDDDFRCENQGAPPEGTGCAALMENGDSDPERGDMYGRGATPRPPGVLPRQCVNVYSLPAAQ